ncbi:MAG: di-trans,poly-cis-decaprenylcistransferase [Parcubacteria group bacterium CG2_30_36_18]|nr:MAG: di-trans,poly-cis-decaprenylcistransferase [Parcubacteria group bacterium CG2_30_36_18]
MKNIPNHVAIIPDGNRRWARKRGIKAWLGHREGVKAFEKILDKSRELKIPYITFWGGSWDNLTKRSKIEINFLFKVYTEQFKRVADDKRIHQNKVKINVLGRWKEILPKETQEAIERAMEVTKSYNNFFLTFLLAYDGTDEMLDCVQKIAKISQDKKIKISKNLIKENLWTKDLPPVDLIIRTGCESDPHNSAGFMMWDTIYSQLYFTQTLFPAFSPKEFEQIIEDYSKRERRLGA